jgi:hypothetical protein
MSKPVATLNPGPHARLAASSAERWMNCAGSVNLAAKHPPAPTPFVAAEGTYAHHIAADCLRRGLVCVPEEYVGSKAIVEGHTVTCDEEMVDGVGLYLFTAQDIRLDKEWVELSLHKALKSLDPDMGGTADYVTYSPKLRLLRTVDFKYGAGVFVSADDNKQLKKYAVGAMLSIEEGEQFHDDTILPIQAVENYIVQPRYEGALPVRVEKFAAVDLLEFIGDMLTAAKATRQPDAPLTPGPWCKKTFCPNAHVCPALEAMQHALVKLEFSEIIPVDPKVLGKALSDFDLIEERIKAMRGFAYAQALAGTQIPGWKLVNKKPRRHWTEPDKVIAWAKGRAIEPFEQPELKSPAQMEKGLKKNEKTELAAWAASVSSGITLVPESDARQPVSRAITAADFDAIGGLEVAPKQLTADNIFE